MEKVKKPWGNIKFASVKDVKLVVRSYQIRTAFSDLRNRIIYI
jgi:hypothetical protein